MRKIILDKDELSGTILDLGGGGEGVIGRICGGRVTAIDNRQEELDEATAGARKLLMDARKLQFPDEAFDCVTSFYTLMYIQREDHGAVAREAYRVLKSGGIFHVWDGEIFSAYPEPYLAELDIDAAGEAIRTTYGIIKENAAQDADWVTEVCVRAGFTPVQRVEEAGHFRLAFQK